MTLAAVVGPLGPRGRDGEQQARQGGAVAIRRATEGRPLGGVAVNVPALQTQDQDTEHLVALLTAETRRTCLRGCTSARANAASRLSVPSNQKSLSVIGFVQIIDETGVEFHRDGDVGALQILRAAEPRHESLLGYNLLGYQDNLAMDPRTDVASLE